MLCCCAKPFTAGKRSSCRDFLSRGRQYSRVRGTDRRWNALLSYNLPPYSLVGDWHQHGGDHGQQRNDGLLPVAVGAHSQGVQGHQQGEDLEGAGGGGGGRRRRLSAGSGWLASAVCSTSTWGWGSGRARVAAGAGLEQALAAARCARACPAARAPPHARACILRGGAWEE